MNCVIKFDTTGSSFGILTFYALRLYKHEKSNIILISIFVILLLTILIMQLKFKTHLKTIELNEIDLPLNAFNEIEAEQGWYIEVYNDPIMKVTISSDSIKDLISVNQNKLILLVQELSRFV